MTYEAANIHLRAATRLMQGEEDSPFLSIAAFHISQVVDACLKDEKLLSSLNEREQDILHQSENVLIDWRQGDKIFVPIDYAILVEISDIADKITGKIYEQSKQFEKYPTKIYDDSFTIKDEIKTKSNKER